MSFSPKTRIKILTTGATTSAPAQLKTGEFAYSYVAGTQANNGDRLYIGASAETDGVASTACIGGKYFTDMMDHAHGSLQQNSALITDANSKIAELKVDDLVLDGSTISSAADITISTTASSSDIILSPNNEGKTVIHNPYINGDDADANPLSEYIYDQVAGIASGGTGITLTETDGATASDPNTIVVNLDAQLDGSAGHVAGSYGSSTAIPTFTVNTQGQLTAVGSESISTSFTLAGDSGTDTIDTGNTLTVNGTTNEIVTTVTDDGAAGSGAVTVGLVTNPTISGNLTVSGNLVVSGSQTTVHSDVVTIDDNVFKLGGDSLADVVSGDTLDRGIEFQYHDNTATVTAGNLVSGVTYVIVSGGGTEGTATDFTDSNGPYGASSNDPGTVFAFSGTDTGSGDGVVVPRSALKLGFFGYDDDTADFTFFSDTTNDSSAAATAGTVGKANFAGVKAGLIDISHGTDGTITTSSGNLVLDSTGGTIDINDNVDIEGSLTLGTDLAVTHGGTGLSALTADSVMAVDGSGAIQFLQSTYDDGEASPTNLAGAIVQFDANHDPIVSEIIDGGTY